MTLDLKDNLTNFPFASFTPLSDDAQKAASDYLTEQFEKFNMPVPFMNESMELWAGWARDPMALLSANKDFWRDYFLLTSNLCQKLMMMETDDVMTEERGDRRFRDEEWQENLVFNYVKQFYLLSCRYVSEMVNSSDMEDEKNARKMEFATKQWLDAMAPTNFAMSNPEVIRKTIDTGGRNLMEGLQEMMKDWERGKGEKLLTRMTDFKAFEVGKNVASTEGKVIYEADLFQLIQYTPTTEKVYERPLLIIPPWINKYYILDLRPENSFIKYAVDQGHSVFIMSWVNPDERHANKGFEDYMKDGVLHAIDMVKKETGFKDVNTIGYCIGGTLLASTNAYLATKRTNPINSNTFFTTMIDFTEPGDLGVFIDEAQLDALDKEMAKKGYLDGTSMAAVFNMLRSNDLIWPFFINNYLMGEGPTAFDLLYWNSDSTRLPAANHSYYLRKCYLENKLKEPGGMVLDGVELDVSKIKKPTYFISTVEDHITPWKSTYAGAQLLSGDVRFVLGGSGHIAGIINPPVKNKYDHWINPDMKADAETWLENAEHQEGSWWVDWSQWIAEKSGAMIAPREPGKTLGVIEDAPGKYVKERIIPD